MTDMKQLIVRVDPEVIRQLKVIGLVWESSMAEIVRMWLAAGILEARNRDQFLDEMLRMEEL